MIGRTLGHYQVVEKLGEGGMGEVYRAKDHKLGRDVAIKVLREELATDPERLRRFEQEARSASALNHPNIITIHDIRLRQGYGGQVGKAEDADFIVMEFVEGKTLRELLAEGSLPTKKFLQLATQIAEGLAKAHSAGIIHRDLKPENLMVTSDGYVKILDFGLAKLLPRANVDSEGDTITKEGTVAGAVMGTASYMSPEQALGKPLDARTDVFSFGAVLYEMATAVRACRGPTLAAVFDEILHETPDPPNSLNTAMPRELNEIIYKALEKNPELRYQNAQDLCSDLRCLTRHHDPGNMVRPIATEQSQIRSLAVLPLTNLSLNPEQDYFADGMTEALITDLAKIGALKIVSRTTAMRYKGSDKSLPDIAGELKVDAIVEGSVLCAEERVRIVAQLIDAKTDQHLWAETYEHDLRDIFSLQAEVAKAIAAQIQIKLNQQEVAQFERSRPVNPEAHDYYLKGRYFWHKRSAESLRLALEYFQRALDEDPSCALAHAGLASVYVARASWGFDPPHDIMPQAERAARRALKVDETLAEAHMTLGAVLFFYRWDWMSSEKELRRAIELNPTDAWTRTWYAWHLDSVGRTHEAMSEAKRALEQDPLDLMANANLGYQLCLLRHFDRAVDQLRNTLEMDSNYLPAHIFLTITLAQMGLEDEVHSELKKWASLVGRKEISNAMESAYLKSGYRGSMQAWIDGTIAASEQTYVRATDVVRFCALLEETDLAIRWLEKAYDERDPILVFCKVDPNLDSLRHDRRFQNILDRMNFPE